MDIADNDDDPLADVDRQTAFDLETAAGQFGHELLDLRLDESEVRIPEPRDREQHRDDEPGAEPDSL